MSANDFEEGSGNIAETIVRESRKPQMLAEGHDHGKLYAVPDGFKLSTDSVLESMQNAPSRKKGDVRVKTAESFIAYVNRHKQPETLLYAQIDAKNINTPLVIRAVFNDHQGEGLNATEPGWRDFTATLVPEAAHEWKTWSAHDGKAMGQLEFAVFLDDNIKDVSAQEGYPSGTDMLRMATQFEAAQDKRIKSAIRIQSGGINIECVDTDDSATVERMQAFDKFMLGVPTFWKGQAYLLEAKLRYRAKDGKLALWYDLVRPDIVVNDAVEQILKDVQEKTELTVLYGEIVK